MNHHELEATETGASPAAKRRAVLAALDHSHLPENEKLRILSKMPELDGPRIDKLLAFLSAPSPDEGLPRANRSGRIDVLVEIAEYQRAHGDALDAYGFPSPTGFIRYADRRVVGQRAAKEALAIALYFHAKSLREPGIASAARMVAGPLLGYGPTGVGKTLLHRVMAEAAGLPFLAVNCPALVGEGIVGESLSSCLLGHLERSGGGAEAVKGSVIFFDEVDKLFDPGSVYGEGVGSQLLTLMEGGDVALHRKGGFGEGGQGQRLATDTFLVSMAGAFQGLHVEARNRRAAIGFGGQDEAGTGPAVGAEDLVKAGVPRELIGRFRALVPFSPLGADDLYAILKLEHDGSPLHAIDRLVGGGGLGLGERELREIADKAAASGTGARGLHLRIRELAKSRLLLGAVTGS